MRRRTHLSRSPKKLLMGTSRKYPTQPWKYRRSSPPPSRLVRVGRCSRGTRSAATLGVDSGDPWPPRVNSAPRRQAAWWRGDGLRTRVSGAEHRSTEASSAVTPMPSLARSPSVKTADRRGRDRRERTPVGLRPTVRQNLCNTGGLTPHRSPESLQRLSLLSPIQDHSGGRLVAERDRQSLAHQFAANRLLDFGRIEHRDGVRGVGVQAVQFQA